MAVMNYIERLDAAIASFLGTWNTSTTILAGALLVLLIWPILTGKDPDIHPFLLARQSQASPVRQEGESAVYRANEIPYGYPLRKGLGVKDPGAPKWSAGRDGDLRDIWRAALRGPVDDSGTPSGPRGKLFSIHGRDQPTQREFADVTRSINVIGKYIEENGGQVVAVCLSNSVELLATVFASAFYNFKLVLVPCGLPQDQLNGLLSKSAADFLIGEAGSIELSATTFAAPSIKHAIWVAQSANKDMDWNEVPAGMGGKIELATWHELVEDRKNSVSTDVPASEKDSVPKSISFFWPTSTGQYELIEYTSAQIIAGIGGLLSTTARDQKLSYQDVVVPTSPLTDSYTLCWILKALYSNATIALNSVAGDSVDLAVSASTIKPTIVIASSKSILKHSERILSSSSSGFTAWVNSYFARRSIAAGILTVSPKPSAPVTGKPTSNLSNIRLLFISQRDWETPRLSSSLLSALRLGLGVRIGYALTSSHVAGAISQTNILDYRNKGQITNVGAPVTSVEVWLRNKEDSGDLSGEKPKGKITISGPAVIGKQASLDISAKIDTDHTFILV